MKTRNSRSDGKRRTLTTAILAFLTILSTTLMPAVGQAYTWFGATSFNYASICTWCFSYVQIANRLAASNDTSSQTNHGVRIGGTIWGQQTLTYRTYTSVIRRISLDLETLSTTGDGRVTMKLYKYAPNWTQTLVATSTVTPAPGRRWVDFNLPSGVVGSYGQMFRIHLSANSPNRLNWQNNFLTYGDGQAFWSSDNNSAENTIFDYGFKMWVD